MYYCSIDYSAWKSVTISISGCLGNCSTAIVGNSYRYNLQDTIPFVVELVFNYLQHIFKCLIFENMGVKVDF